ncbi:MAG: hypothetical protein ATN36_02150 [Epulopiscium sp. Nele67-Bin005]|nr:MAG: hypothetical protein ATN36_02150 [Epulopiscium sp. Nele67-Bin005]
MPALESELELTVSLCVCPADGNQTRGRFLFRHAEGNQSSCLSFICDKTLVLCSDTQVCSNK